MTRQDRQRQDLTRAINQILWAWPHATLDAESRGFGQNGDAGGSETGRHADPTSACALAALDPPPGTLTDALIQARAEHWLTAWRALAAMICVDAGIRLPRWNPEHATPPLRAAILEINPVPPVTDRAYRLADQALAWWPPAPKPAKPGTRLKTGDDDDGACAECGLPAPTGRDYDTGLPLAKTLNGRRYHFTAKMGAACWWVVWRRQGARCQQNGCDRPVKAGGLCSTHWAQARRISA